MFNGRGNKISSEKLLTMKAESEGCPTLRPHEPSSSTVAYQASVHFPAAAGVDEAPPPGSSGWRINSVSLLGGTHHLSHQEAVNKLSNIKLKI